jgi:hypothetical protein
MSIAMENDSSLNATLNESALVLVPIGAVAFAPFLLLELVAAVVSNAILLALVILACVKKLNNNINIYLFSLAVGGLMGAFCIFCLLVLVLVHRWILGFVICSINWYITIFYNFFFLLIYLAISRDKLKEVKDPIYGRPTNKRAYLNSALLWISTSGVAIGLYLAWVFRNTNQLGSLKLFIEHGNFICFGLSNQGVDEMIRFMLLSLSVFCIWVASTIIIAVTFLNFMYILVELRKLKMFRLRFAEGDQANRNIGIENLDKPLFRTGEERTAKSLVFVFFIQFSCIIISFGMTFAQVITTFIQPQDSPNFQFYFVTLLTVQFFPCINPVFLILSNKRLRTRVKELFKCTLNPEMEGSPIHNLKPYKKDFSIVFLMKRNQVSPMVILE